MHWINIDWWKYLLSEPSSCEDSRWRAFWCRARGHPYGVVWYTLYGYEPDMHCKNCGDDLG